MMSTIDEEAAHWLEELPEPDALAPDEFLAWRGLIRLRETVMREIDHRLRAQGLISLADYGLLITLVTEPTLKLRMSDLGARRMLTPSGITRVVNRLEAKGLVHRAPDPADGRASFAALTKDGLKALRRAQVVHHAVVRELYVGRLEPHELKELARLFEKALPEVVTAPAWPARAAAPTPRAPRPSEAHSDDRPRARRVLRAPFGTPRRFFRGR